MDQADKLRQLVTSHSYRDERPQNVLFPRILVVTSGKGGVGKSNVTLNLSLALHRQGKSVLILDTDIGFSNIDVLMGRTAKHHLIEALENNIPVDRLIEKSPYGFSYISGGRGFNQLPNLSQPLVERFVEKMNQLTNGLDYLLIDTGAGLSALDLKMMLHCDDVLVVTTPEPTSITDAYAVIKMVSRHDTTRRFHIIVNRASKKEGVNTANNLISAAKHFLGIDVLYLGHITEDIHVSKAVKNQQPFLAAYPDCAAAYNLQMIVRQFQYGEPDQGGGVKQFFYRLFFKKGGG
jgi:flagellar biosynthesis protein FlhG